MKAVLLVVFLASAITSIVADKKIVCYYGSWAAYRPGLGAFEPSNINPALCTHMVYSFAGITIDGNVQVLDSWQDLPSGKNGYGKFTSLRASSPKTKALIAIGGWNEGSVKYSQVAADPALRARFAQDVVNFLRTYNFDGLDLDWEYPNQRGGNPADRTNFILLLKELKEAFKNQFSLSVAVAALQSSASLSYDIPNLSQIVDFINLMTFDFSGSWNIRTGINAPPSAVDAAIKYWLSQGAPADKLLVGLPSYGSSFTLANPASNDVNALASGPGIAGPYTRVAGTLGYNEICEKVRQGWTEKRDKEGSPYAFSGNQWVGYDDAKSTADKANYVLSKGLGGIMIWSIDQDDFQGTCGEKYPLLSTINKIFGGKLLH